MRLIKTIFIFLDFISTLIAILILKLDANFFLLITTFYWILLNYLFNKYKFLDKKYKKSFMEISISSLKSFFILIPTLKLVNLLVPNISFSFFSVLFSLFLISSLSGIIFRLILEFFIQIFDINRNVYFILNAKKNLNFSKKYDFFDNENNEFISIKSTSDIYKNLKNLKFKNCFLITKDKYLTENEIINLKINNVKIQNIDEWLEKNRFILIPEETEQKDIFLKNNYSKIIYQRFLKRSLDFICSLIILILSSPILLISIILIFIEDGGSVIYSQKRTGYKNREIKIYKLRTMSINSEKDGPKWAKAKDKRITKIGSFLRLTRVDELPQLINVMKGEMSLIGPRPERPEIDKILENKIINYKLRYLTKPGISGWAQVNYPYASSVNDTYNKLSFDLFYIKHQNLFLDLYIFIRTIKVIFNIKGSKPNS